jgi:SAM-dependent methyltransferase
MSSEVGRTEYRKLHAEWYELRSGDAKDHTEEIEFWANRIAEAGGPALELGSGTGRVFVPLLERGLDIVGLDNSPDMTARCLEACEARGLTPEIRDQSMLSFELHREFGLIFLGSGGLGLFPLDEDIAATFARVAAHLRPGGHFIYEFQPVWGGFKWDNKWRGDWAKGADGVVMASRQRGEYDADTNAWKILLVLEKFVDGRLIETEANEREGRFFTVEEAVGYARSAGFVEVEATNWLTQDPPSEDSVVVTVRCRKPGGEVQSGS